MEAQEYARACAKFAESQNIAPGGGTLLNLAVCREKAGNLATAWALFHEAEVVARQERRTRRVALAQERIKALAPRLPKLTLTPKGDAEQREFSLELDGATLSQAVFGTPFPVDPGDHTLEASADGYAKWSHTFTIEEAQFLAVEIPSLVANPTPVEVAAVDSDGAKQIEFQDRSAEGKGRRRWGVALVGVGTIGLVSGAVFAFKSDSALKDSYAYCVDSVCEPEGVRLNEEAKRSALLADVQFVAGLAFVGVGGYLLLTESGSPPRSQRTGNGSVAPTAAHSQPRFLGATIQPMPSGAGISAWGRW